MILLFTTPSILFSFLQKREENIFLSIRTKRSTEKNIAQTHFFSYFRQNTAKIPENLNYETISQIDFQLILRKLQSIKIKSEKTLNNQNFAFSPQIQLIHDEHKMRQKDKNKGFFINLVINIFSINLVHKVWFFILMTHPLLQTY